jgi:hypothetical protein
MEVQMILMMDMATGQRLDEEEGTLPEREPTRHWSSVPVEHVALQEVARETEASGPPRIVSPRVARASTVTAARLH